jgi:hypothetical protein
MDNGFLRSLQPARWCDDEVSLMEFVDAVMELARVSPSAAWIAGVIGLHPWQLALFHEWALQEMWGKDPTLMHSSSYHPTGKAETAADGYKLSGRWSFSSLRKLSLSLRRTGIRSEVHPLWISVASLHPPAGKGAGPLLAARWLGNTTGTNGGR